MDQKEQYIGPVLPGQGWVELRGVFTLSELEKLIDKIKVNYENISNE